MNKKNANNISKYKDLRVHSLYKMAEYANQSPYDRVIFQLREENGDFIKLYLYVHRRKNYMEGPVGLYFELTRTELQYHNLEVQLLFQMLHYAQMVQRVPKDKVFFVLHEESGLEYALQLQSFEKGPDSVIFTLTRKELAESIPDVPLDELIDMKTWEIYNQLKKGEENK
jgi:hypothetical protein